jgi:hypothetical protein
MSIDESPLVVVADVGAVLDRLRVPYIVGGSIASSFHGIPRATQDADFIAALNEGVIASFVDALGDDYYADPDMIRDAVARRASFNLVHRPTMFKVDVFVHARRFVFARRDAARHRRVRRDIERPTFWM